MLQKEGKVLLVHLGNLSGTYDTALIAKYRWNTRKQSDIIKADQLSYQ